MEIEPNWDDLRLLLAVAQRGSFLGAAKQLNLAVSTVSRRLTKLEDTMGYPLLERGVDGSTLTTKGRALADISRDLSRDIEHERDKSTGESGRLSGLIRLMLIPKALCISSKKHSALITESSTLRLCWPEVRRPQISQRFWPTRRHAAS